jgi:hypothetical protein
MNKLQQLIKNPNCRFKTTTEMVNDYGQNYMDLIMNMETLDVLTIMSLFGGKKLYPELVKDVKWNNKEKSFFLYGPTESVSHVMMLTTHAYPKWSSRAEILKPGMLVTVEYGIPIKEHTVPSCFRNAPGTTVRILKVVKPTAYFRTSIIGGDMVDKYHVATELLKPATDQSKGEVKYNHLFKNCKVVAFEISWHLRKATEVERKFYYSQFHTSEISCSPKSDKGHLGFVDGRE